MMLFLRLRKAELALANGRLEEAYQEVLTPEVRDHHRGQKLLGNLATAFAKRGSNHLERGDARAALADVERALRLGGQQPAFAELRQEADRILQQEQQAARTRQAKLAAVKQCLANGDIDMGKQLLEPGVDQGKTMLGLMQDADRLQKNIQQSIHQIELALQTQQWDVAYVALNQLQQLQPRGSDGNRLRRELVRLASRQAQEHIVQGRLDLANNVLERLEGLSVEPEMTELHKIIQKCRSATLASRSLDVAPATENLKSLRMLLPEARWLSQAIEAMEGVGRSLEALRTGPLGLLCSSADTRTTIPTPVPTPVRGGGIAPVIRPQSVSTDAFLIHLDGAGSFLVVCKSQVTLGVTSRSQPVDIPVLGQAGLPRMTLERMEDDYFLNAETPVLVNQSAVKHHLLAHRDLIQLGPRGAVEFLLPCAASRSAVLDFRGVRLASGNTRRVVLLDDAIVFGPTGSAHIQVPQLDRAMVLYKRQETLFLRPMSRTTETDGMAVAWNQPHDMDGLSLVVTGIQPMLA